jgi:hypothetical protein
VKLRASIFSPFSQVLRQASGTSARYCPSLPQKTNISCKHQLGIITFAATFKNKYQMDKKKLPVSLDIALTLRAIEHAFKKSIQELNTDFPSESFGILMITCIQDNIIQQDIAAMPKICGNGVLNWCDYKKMKHYLHYETGK